MPTQESPVTIALIGNPNTGKSTLFNALAGLRQRVGNYPGVTVERKTGRYDLDGAQFTVVDLPGTYSLAPRSPDEMVAVDVLLGRRADVPEPDVVVCIVDATNLQRNLYLVSQVLELGRPTLLALNMIDLAKEQGIEIDVDRLRRQLGIPVFEIQANRKTGIHELKSGIAQASGAHGATPQSPFPEPFQQEVAELEVQTKRNGQPQLPRYLVERLLLDTTGYLATEHLPAVDETFLKQVDAARARLAAAGFAVPAVEAVSRYSWVGEVLEGVVSRPQETRATLSDRIDKVLTHRIWGALFFAALMAGIFCLIFIVADTPMGWIDAGIGAFGGWVERMMPEGALRSLVVDGVIGGVGAVVIFLPQILMLFFFIAIMEASGYMARAAYLMDKLMSRVGLSGKSFIPLLSSFACAIPGIMAARVIENRRDRLTTILVAPLMSCSARLPVYIILIGAFIPTTTALGGFLPGLVLFAMYLIGVVTAVIVALVLKKTLLKGATPPFVMELPGYKIPSLTGVLHRMFDRGWAFVRRAGTLILAVMIVVWALGYFPRNDAEVEAPFVAERSAIESQLAALGSGEADDSQREALQTRMSEIENAVDQRHLRQSYLGRAGQFVEPVVKPLGWDWRIGCAAIASFPAREVVMGTLGVIYNLGGELDVGEESDQERLQGRLKAAKWDDSEELVYNVPVALSIMVFFALCAQCASTLVIMKRETNSWRWPIFTFVYMTTLAYLGALVTYQVGMLL